MKVMDEATSLGIAQHQWAACSTPNPDALALLSRHLNDIVTVSDDEALDALRLLRQHTGLLIEGSAALPLAALRKSGLKDQTLGLILSGGNLSAQVRQAVG